MKKQITHVFIFQSSKIIAILSCIISILIAVPLGFYSLYHGNRDEAVDLFIQPLIHLAVSFITSIIVFFLYNQLVKLFGGIAISTTDVE